MTYTILNSTTGQRIESHTSATQAARAAAILNAHNRMNGHAERYAYSPPDPAGEFELPDWAKPFATE